ncbi:MAG: mucoidy inhibitor MuiA family protein [Opitutales bacterium]|jgi:uncharacterized protein (TIGR02231 family)
MKPLKYLPILCLCLSTTACPGAASTIQQVELYPTGATVTRVVPIEPADTGDQTVRVENFPSGLVDSSIQIGIGKGPALRIGGFAFLPQENAVEEDDPRTADLRAQLKDLDRQADTLRKAQDAATARIRYYEGLAGEIRVSLKEKADPESFELAQVAWKEAETIRRAGQEELVKCSDQLDELKRSRAEIQKELNELVADLRRLAGVLQFDIKGDLSAGAELIVRYQVQEAGWQPVHEVRADPSSGTVEWVSKARIHQSSGEDWTGVRMALNSASAINAGGLPHLPPLFLSRVEGRYIESSMVRAKSMDMVQMAPPALAAESEIESTTTGFYIVLGTPVSVESGEPPVVRDALRGSLKTEFWSEAVPEFSTEAWLMGGLTNELGYPVLPGELYCYIDGQLVARRYTGSISVGEEVELALGRNEKIVVERVERLRKESEGGLIDKTKRHNIKYETTVNNRMPVVHRVVLQDRFPIGRDNKIQVRTLSPDDVEPEEGTGIFKWERTIEPGAKAVMTTEYSVLYPSEWTVVPKL